VPRRAGVGALRDEPYAGHVDARESEPGDDAKQRRGDDVVGGDRERDVGERGMSAPIAMTRDGLMRSVSGRTTSNRGGVAEEVRGDDPAERGARPVPLGAQERERRRRKLRRQKDERERR